MPITVSELADHRLGRRAEHGGDFEEAGLPIMGGCVGCGASVAAYNAFPSRSGYLACRDCVGGAGWNDVKQADRDIFGSGSDWQHWSAI